MGHCSEQILARRREFRQKRAKLRKGSKGFFFFKSRDDGRDEFSVAAWRLTVIQRYGWGGGSFQQPGNSEWNVLERDFVPLCDGTTRRRSKMNVLPSEINFLIYFGIWRLKLNIFLISKLYFTESYTTNNSLELLCWVLHRQSSHNCTFNWTEDTTLVRKQHMTQIRKWNICTLPVICKTKLRCVSDCWRG